VDTDNAMLIRVFIHDVDYIDVDVHGNVYG